MRGVGTPPIRVLLTIYISKYYLETAAMQREHDHISSGKAGSGQGSEKELRDQPITGHTNRSLGSGRRMSGDNHPTAMAFCGDWQVSTVKEVPTGATVWMGTLLIGGQGEALLDLCQFQQGIIFASHHEAYSRCDQIHDDGTVAIQTVESNKGLTWQKAQRSLISNDHGESPQQLTSVISIARCSTGEEPLMGMGAARSVVRVRTISPRLRPM